MIHSCRCSRELIEDVFARALSASEIDVQADAVPIDLGSGEVMITTDGFTVQPLEFPGGNIGSLAIHGTTNDLAVAGTIAADAELAIENADVVVRCKTCDVNTKVQANRLVCGQCGDFRTTLVSGDEMILQRVELDASADTG